MSRRNRKGKRASARGSVRLAMAPPQLRSNIVLKHKYRFTSASATMHTVGSVGLVLAAGAMCTTSNALVTTLFGSVKLDRIEMWSPPPSQGAFATCSVEFIGSASSNTLEYSDTSVSTAVPAHLTCVPPPRSLASFWQTPGVASVALFNLIAPVGSIIDVTLSLIMWDDEFAAVQRIVASGFLGTLYYLALDNASGHDYVPVSLTTTF